MTIKSFKDANSWQKRFDALSPKLDEVAPGFTLSDKQGKHPVTLSEINSKYPVALIFGSFT